MEYLRLLYELPAIVAGTTILAYLSPVKIAHRFTPLLMFIVGLVVLQLPEFIDMALCLTIPAAWLLGQFSIDLHGHEPLKVSVKLPKLPNRIPIRQFVTRAYPDPAAETGEPDDEDESPTERGEVPVVKSQEPPELVTEVQKFVPPL